MASKKTASKKLPLKKVPPKKPMATATPAAEAAPAAEGTTTEVSQEPVVDATPDTQSKAAGKKTASKKVATKKAPADKTEQVQVQAKPAEKKKIDKGDVFGSVAQQMASITRAKALQMASSLSEDVTSQSFRLGALFSKIKEKQWYLDEGYEDFKSYVADNCPVSYRTIDYWIRTSNYLIESGVEYSKVEHLGWTKLKEIAELLTQDNVDELVTIAEDRTTIQLQQYVRDMNKTEAGTPVQSSDKDWSTMSFKLHKDQREVVDDALDKAMEAAETDVKTVGLEAICLAYLSGGKPKKPNATMLVPVIKAAGWEATLEAIEKEYPHVSLSATVADEGTEVEEDDEPADEEELEDEEVDGEDEADDDIDEDVEDEESDDAEELFDDEVEYEDDDVEEEESDDADDTEDEDEEVEYEEIEVDEDGNEIEYEEVEEDEEDEEVGTA